MLPQVIKDLLSSEKGFVLVLLLIAASVLAIMGKMTVDAWTQYTLVISGIHAGGTGLRAIGHGIGNRRDAQAARDERDAYVDAVVSNGGASEDDGEEDDE